jgi:hypothetical protein
MYMIGKIIAIFHLFVAFFYSFYAFIVPKNPFYDYCYFVFLICVQLSWLVCNHECPLSYLYKYIHYKNYNCGDTTTLDDFKELTGEKSTTHTNKNVVDYSKLVDTIFTCFLIMSIIITGVRSNLANIFVVCFVLIFIRFLYIFLNNALGYNSPQIFKNFLGKYYSNFKNIHDYLQITKIHNEINIIIAIICILFLLHITYRNRKFF